MGILDFNNYLRDGRKASRAWSAGTRHKPSQAASERNLEVVSVVSTKQKITGKVSLKELNESEPLYEASLLLSSCIKSMISTTHTTRIAETCLLAVRCTVYRWQDLQIGSQMEQEKPIRHGKRKSRIDSKAESIDGRIGGGYSRSSEEDSVMELERRGIRIQRLSLGNFERRRMQ